MDSDKKIFDDIARVAGGAVNALSGLQHQVRDEVRARMDEFAGRFDLVPREDFDRAEAMIKKLSARLDALEKGGGKKAASVKRKVGAKAGAAKKTVKKAVKKTTVKAKKKTPAKPKKAGKKGRK